MTSTIRILTVDDHPLLRQGIASLLAGEPDMSVVAEATTGREAVEQFRKHRPDVTLMDLQMPEMSGLEATIAIRGEFPDARIIVLTTYGGDVQVVRALKAGARRVPPEEHAAQGAGGRDSGGPYRQEGPVPGGLIRGRRACDDGRAVAGGGPRPAPHLRGPVQQGDRGDTRAQRRHREGPGQEHPVQAGRAAIARRRR